MLLIPSISDGILSEWVFPNPNCRSDTFHLCLIDSKKSGSRVYMSIASDLYFYCYGIFLLYSSTKGINFGVIEFYNIKLITFDFWP